MLIPFWFNASRPTRQLASWPEMPPGWCGVRPDRVAMQFRLERIATSSSLVTGHRFNNGNDEGDYFNFDFDTSQPAALWTKIQEVVYDSSPFGQDVRRSSMGICTGHNCWEDYLLIHHWDPDKDLDEVPAT